jgi:apolipoprotein N-acyltransferase
MLAAIWGLGAARLAAAPASAELASATRLRLVQPAIEQTLKNDPEASIRNVGVSLELSRAPTAGRGFQHLVWPEAAVPFLLEREAELRGALAAALPAGGYLLTGAPRGEPASGPLSQIWNSLLVVTGTGGIAASFDKFHLVPLGEYVPLRELLPFISKLTPGGMDYSAGPGPRTIRVPGLPPFAAIICYEAIFPHQVVDEADRPDWIVNLTNDAWFGRSTGPYQHFATARLRAVEEGLPLVRVANSGISGLIDPYGRVEEMLPLGARGTLDINLPLPIPQTIFARYGLWTSLACGLLILALTLVLHRAMNRAPREGN